MTFEMYTAGFGDLIRMGLDLTAMIFNYVMSSPLVAIAVIVGVAYVAVQSLAKGKLDIMQLVLALLLFLVAFVPRVDVAVVDLLGDETSSANGFVVEDVPIGLALAGSITSAGAAWMSSLYQTIYYNNESTGPQFTNQQFAFPLRVMMHIRDVEACDLGVNFCKNLATYTRLCYQPALASGNFDQEGVYQRPERAFDAGWLNAKGAMQYHLQSGQSELKSCREAGEALEEHLEEVLTPGTAAHGHFSRYLRAKMGDAPDDQTQEGGTSIEAGVVRDVAQTILGPVSEQRNFTVSHIARQVHNAAESGEFGSGASALWLNQTMERNRLITSVEASGMLRMVMILAGLMQFLFIVMTPIVAIVAVTKMAAGFKLYGSWILFALWSSMFLITVTVIDFWAQRAVQTRFTERYLSSTEYDALSVPGLQGAYAAVADILQTAFSFMTYVPLVTLVILTGSIYGLAALASRVGGGPEATNLAGTQAVADKAAIRAPFEYNPADNNPHWEGSPPPTVLHGASQVTQSEALQSQLEATHELRDSSEQAVVSSFQTAVNEDFSTLRQGIDAETSSDEYRDAIEGTRRWLDTVTGDSSISEQMSDKEVAAFTKYWQMGATLGGSTPGAIGLGGSIGGGIKGESSETQETVESVAERVNEQLQGVAQTGTSVQQLNSIAEQWTSQESGSHSEAWREVQSNADSFKHATSEIDSLRDTLSTSSQLGSSVALNSSTIQGLEGELSDYGGIPGYLDARANQYGDDVREQITQGGGLPDPSAPERADENLSAVLRLSGMASDNDLPSETRYAASDMLNSLFERMTGSGVSVADEEALSGPSIDSPVDQTGIGGQHIAAEAHRSEAQAKIDNAREGVEQARASSPSMDEVKDRAWSGILQEQVNEARMEENARLDERLPEERAHLSAYASSLVPEDMHLMSYASFNTFDEALERAQSYDADPGKGDGHEDFVRAMGYYWADPDTNEVNMEGFNQDLRSFTRWGAGEGPGKALNAESVAWMVSMSESATESSEVAWLWAHDHLDSETMRAAPEEMQAHADMLNHQLASSELVGEWKSLVQSGYDSGGTAGELITNGEVTQSDVARYAFERLADPRSSEPMHAGLVHDAIAMHGDFDQQEIDRIAKLEAEGDKAGANSALMDILGIEPSHGPFGDHVRVERELHPQTIREAAVEAGAVENEYSGQSPLRGKL